MSRLPSIVADQLFGLLAPSFGERRGLDHVGHFADQLARQRREIVDEIERVLDLVGDAGGELAEGSELFRLDQPILRFAQVVERGGELLGARLHLVEQARVLDGDDGLVGEGLDDFDFPVGESDRLISRHAENADRLPFADQGHP